MFRGEITSQNTLIVGESGEIQASIQSSSIVISGTVEGDIVGAKKVVLHKTARVNGDVETPCIVIEEGAVFNGQERWLEVTVAGEPLPRQEILPVPYALSLVSGTVISGTSTLALLTVINPDGQFVAFVSEASDLHPLDGDDSPDVFVLDRDTDGNGIFDETEGVVTVADIDAYDGTPIVDLKGYFPVCDRVKQTRIPEWLSDWPEWMPEDGIGL